MHYQSTIAAIATAPGRGGVGMIRLSGPKAYAIAEQLTAKALPKARMAGFRQFYDAQAQVMDEDCYCAFQILTLLLAKMSWRFRDTAGR